jgi:putative ABC transport system permease protein
MINKALARKLGWTDPVGKKIFRSGEHTIIGVLENYNFSPLHQQIEPLIITIKPWQGYDYITVRFSGKEPEVIKSLEEKWKSAVPYEDFKSFSLESYVSEAYDQEKGYMYMLLFCSFLTVFIAALGLFGLAAFITRKRYKEIAVRKVFGAGMNGIFILVSTGFLSLVIIANIIAWPIAYFFMDHYFLTRYANNSGIHWWVFFVVLVFSIGISLLVILFQIYRLSRLNPVDYIRYE